MKKNKLIEMRNFKGFTQQQIAQELCMGITAYNRRENGQVSININQWEKLAEILNVPLKEIFEGEEKQVFLCQDNASQNTQNNYGTNNYYTIQDTLLENQQKYITKLEEEIKELKQRIENNVK